VVLRRIGVTSLLLVPLAASEACGKHCTLIGCVNGLDVTFRHEYAQPGAYKFVITVDGRETICELTLPPPDPKQFGCGNPDVGVVASLRAVDGSDSYSFIGFRSSRMDIQTISIEVSKDGTLLDKATLNPSYVTTPGPNGPDCSPESCTYAKADFP
jgi:hypothetical protein